MHTSTQARPVLRSFLIIDPERAYLDKLAEDPRFAELSPVLTPPGPQADRWLSADEWCFRAIFVSSAVMNPGIVPMIAHLHRQHPATPLFVIHGGPPPPFSEREQQRLAVHGALTKPASLGEYVALVNPAAANDMNASLPAPAPAKRARKTLNETETRTEEDLAYVPVAAEELLHGLPMFFDVYIRVPAGRYLKILNAKETLDPERVLNFIELGTRHLYLRRSGYERCLNYCDIMAQALLRNPDVSTEVKLLSTLSSAQRLIALLAESKSDLSSETDPLGPLHAEFALAYVSELYQLLSEARAERDEARRLIDAFLRVGPSLDHGLAVSVAAGLLALPLGIESRKPFQQLAMAAFFHDVGLKRGVTEEEDPRHGARSAELLSALPGMDEGALQAVALHHEQRGAPGTPLLAEIVGLANELGARLAKKATPAQVLEDLAREVLPRFSSRVAEAFHSIFS